MTKKETKLVDLNYYIEQEAASVYTVHRIHGNSKTKKQFVMMPGALEWIREDRKATEEAAQYPKYYDEQGILLMGRPNV